MDALALSALNGLSYSLLLFLLASGLTLIFSLLGVLNFAHGSFYMLGAYLAWQSSQWFGFWGGLVIAPLGLALLGTAFEVGVLRPLRARGHLPELLATFALGIVQVEVVRLLWGNGSVPYAIPHALQGSLLTLGGVDFPVYRGFVMAMALAALAVAWLLLWRTRAGLIVQAALTHAPMVQALGHDVRAVQTGVFAAGAALAGLAGAVGGPLLITEPDMAAQMGALLFAVIIIGGLGSLRGAMLGALLVGEVQTLAVAVNGSIADVLARLGWQTPAAWPARDGLLASLLHLDLARAAPLLPYLLLVVVMVLRPQGLTRRFALREPS
ncbi:branched-chain amino acid ABC transporter permease [Thiomonas bhubaneswarensis]|uniref:Amino acid/amide ABC transporter membrane protein 1, HAAT family (TC 3.A.1.4.-) n=1 Tax=Thiomonas bhubaneswarensis TaxID=339866 RepID=A0A0K6I2T1_9BURK|nr:branched-chain amino acid ABC transporter permease [Thiomonas bhubaneswarensis]CUA97464.1 amino acid/amide ABC transporter membrane protein 1, HAAT family (TC 3.A.1.4.-) [Thiomonas bhubaneswarensis]